MNVLILFLLGSFLAGGLRSTWVFRRWPVALLAVCVVVGASFYSLRVVS